ncbi:Citrinin biosynthesis transcriptional activator ctnR [Fusarium oxysporum f. sp. albedinis]|nr:Citrinin biosynthesis transcriptional activator ctnR [Fusarium oxysporum f. sp. albedinis]
MRVLRRKATHQIVHFQSESSEEVEQLASEAPTPLWGFSPWYLSGGVLHHGAGHRTRLNEWGKMMEAQSPRRTVTFGHATVAPRTLDGSSPVITVGLALLSRRKCKMDAPIQASMHCREARP